MHPTRMPEQVRMKRDEEIFVAGHGGMVGSAILRNLQHRGYSNLLFRERTELNLLDQAAVKDFFRSQKVESVIIAAAKVGGIQANRSNQAEFLYENLTIATNVIDAAYHSGVQNLLFLGSSCIYPNNSPQPITESNLLAGPLEESNEGYAIAKIAGLKLCEWYNRQYGVRFISLMPTNLYGPNDNFHPDYSHVVPGLINRFHHAKESGEKEVVVWGDGSPRRDLLHVDDLVEAIHVLLSDYHGPETINVGSGQDYTIAEIAELVKKVVGFSGRIVFDTSKPTGMVRKLLDISKIEKLGWKPTISLEEGLLEVYEWAQENQALVNK